MNQRALERLRQAERHANWRDRELRYGSPYRPPYGYESRWYRRTRRQPEPLRDVITVLVLALLVGVIFGLSV